jgi:hypothetical protein
MPRTELPCSSSLDDQTQMPIRPGITTMSAPDTPLLAGRPIVNATSPEKSSGRRTPNHGPTAGVVAARTVIGR